MSYRLHHVHIICKSLEQMINFFTENFEATLIAMRKFGTADGASLDLQGSTINLRVAREDEDMLEDFSGKPYGYDHIGIEVDNIDAKFEELKNKGFAFSIPPTDIEKIRIAFFDGPENITIELVEQRG